MSHDATRTGAPMALLHFLRWFKANDNRSFSVLLGGGGDLTGDFEKVAETWPTDGSRWCPGGRRAQLLSGMGLGERAIRAHEADVQQFASGCSPALVYANSISSAPTIELVAPQVPLLTHVHELEFAFRRNEGPALSDLMTHTCRFIACSNAVRRNLTDAHGVPPARVETVHESIPVDEVRAQRTREEVLRELRMADDSLLVAGGGTAGWRKGTDLFVQLAGAVCRQRPRARFAWIGGWQPELAELEYDIRLSGLNEKARVTGLVTRPADYLGAADVFVLTSREDPYPLVCLEAAALGKPIVCFADAGGMPEFVEDDCGFVVPYLDVMAMADRVMCLLDSRERRAAIGEAARRKVRERHDISVAAPRIAETIERTIAGE